MPSNTAAYLTAENTPLEVKSAPYTSPSENDIVIKNAAIALNPVDWARQQFTLRFFAETTFPEVLGSDVAGEVVEVGSNVSRFRVGDRVLGLCLNGSKRNKPAEGGFQLYTVLQANVACHISSSLSYEEAAVIPLGLSTAACGLFQKDYLALQYPTVSPKATGKTVIIWSGASSVGSNAIQLAVAVGYEVFTTSSPKNFPLVKSLGAAQAFDYNSPTVVADIIAALKGKSLIGALAIGNIAAAGNGAAAAEMCCEIVDRCCEGRKFVALAMHPPEGLPGSVEAKFILGAGLSNNELGDVIYKDFLPVALGKGSFVPRPEPLIAGKGLESLQEALDMLKKGVSARKVVVQL